MMFYCLDCKEYFDESEMVTKTTWSHSNYIGFGGYFPETESYCPYCGSEDFEEAKAECDGCKEFVYETKEVNGIYLCPDCYEIVKDILDEAVDKIVGELDMDALEVHALISGFYDDY